MNCLCHCKVILRFFVTRKGILMELRSMRQVCSIVMSVFWDHHNNLFTMSVSALGLALYKWLSVFKIFD